MTFNLLNITLFIGCFLIANLLHRIAKKSEYSRFQQSDFLLAILLYLFSFERLMALLNLSSLGMVIMGIEIFICIKLLLSLKQIVPEMFNLGINNETFIARTREQIRQQIIQERIS